MRQPLCFAICFAIYSPSENMELAREVTKDSSTLKISAHQKPSTTILSIKQSAIKIITALITRANNPSVMIVSGKPKSPKIGFTKIFSTPNTMAKIIAEENPSKCTPGSTLVKRYATIAVMNSLIIKFILLFFNVMLSTLQILFQLALKKAVRSFIY